MSGNMVVSRLRDLLTTECGVRDYVFKSIKLDELVATLLSTQNLGVNVTYLNGYPLTEYVTDDRLKSLVAPRGVYVETTNLATNLLDGVCIMQSEKKVKVEAPDSLIHGFDGSALSGKISYSSFKVESSTILTPSEFKYEQAKLFGAIRSTMKDGKNLKENSEAISLSDAAKRSVVDGRVHYTDTAFLPLKLNVAGLYDNTYYNYKLEDMINDFVTGIVKSFKD